VIAIEELQGFGDRKLGKSLHWKGIWLMVKRVIWQPNRDRIFQFYR